MNKITIILTALSILTACYGVEQGNNIISFNKKDGIFEIINTPNTFIIKSNGLKISIIDKFKKVERIYAGKGYSIRINEFNEIIGDGIVNVDYKEQGYFGISDFDKKWYIHHNEVEFYNAKNDGPLLEYVFEIKENGKF